MGIFNEFLIGSFYRNIFHAEKIRHWIGKTGQKRIINSNVNTVGIILGLSDGSERIFCFFVFFAASRLLH
jgi:hypothetical protein